MPVEKARVLAQPVITRERRAAEDEISPADLRSPMLEREVRRTASLSPFTTTSAEAFDPEAWKHEPTDRLTQWGFYFYMGMVGISVLYAVGATFVW